MMRVAILVHRLGPYHQARFQALSKKCALSVIEYSSVDRTYDWDVVEPSGYSMTRLFVDDDISRKSMRMITGSMCAALVHIAPQVVAIPGWSSPASLAALAWCRVKRIPAVLMADSTEEDEPRVSWREWIKSRIVRLFASALVGGARHVDYVTKLGLPRTVVLAGYDIVDNDYFARRAMQARAAASEVRAHYDLPERYFLASARFVKKKNLGRLMEAYAAYVARVHEVAWDLVLLGDGELKGSLLASIRQLGIESRVHMPGFVQYSELPVYYAMAGVFIHASTTEQWGLVVNEAMASRLPLLVSKHCGCAPDLVREGINGFTFDPLDVDALSTRMAEMANHVYDLNAMGHASYDIIRRFSPESFSENLCQAAAIALTTPESATRPLDRMLLWLVARR